MSANPRRKSEWITSSFGSFTSTQSSQAKGRRTPKRKQDDRISGSSRPGAFRSLDSCKIPNAALPWTEKYSPVTESDLAVHKKKIAEVKAWLSSTIHHSNSTLHGKRDHSNILLLTGPAGAGKSATIDVLKRDLNFEVQEWSMPVTNTSEEYSSWKDFRILSVDSQKKQFQDFLLRANKYPTLSISGKEKVKSAPGKKIILVEDIPNTFYRNLKDFHEILRTFHATSRNPLVFIISDSFIGENSLYYLFPKRLKLELKITSISFNAVVNSIMTKTISRIVDAEAQLNAKNFKIPSKDMLDLLVSSANGDIRACINSLQFHCTNESASTTKCSTSSRSPIENKPATRSKRKLEAPDDSKDLLFGRDTPLFLFRALGKILYCKRESVKEDWTLRPNILQHFTRDKLLIDPEDIIEKTHVQYDTFNLYLHQNYLGFYKNVDDAASASKYFSDADIVTGRWSTREALQAYSSSIAARGVIFSNCSRSNSTTGAVSGGWRQLHKPQWFEAFKEGNLNKRTAEDLFYDLRHPAVDLHTEVLPFIAKSNISLRTPSHIAFVQMISRFNIYTSRSSSTLGQNENGPPDEITTEEQSENDKAKSFKPCEDETESLSQIMVETQQSSEDTNNFEECLIEDFSDEDDLAELLMI